MLTQQKTENPMGAGKKQALRVTFDSRLKLEFHSSKVTSDAGLLAYREPDEALGLTDLGEELLSEIRIAMKQIKHCRTVDTNDHAGLQRVCGGFAGHFPSQG